MILEFLRKEQYGNIRFFGLNKNAETILKLMKRKTLDPDQIVICEDGGWTAIIKHPS